MSRRRVRRGARRGRKRETGWIAGMIPQCWEPLRTWSCEQTEIPWSEATDYFELVGPTDVATTGRTLSVRRIVGQLQLFAQGVMQGPGGPGWGAINFDMGIIISDVDENDAILGRAPGFVIADQESGDWLWRHSWSWHMSIDEGVASGARITELLSNQYSPSADIDIRVGRKLQEREGLYLAVLATGTASAGQVFLNLIGHLRGNVRCLALEP